jgi:hypothetical protein
LFAFSDRLRVKKDNSNGCLEVVNGSAAGPGIENGKEPFKSSQFPTDAALAKARAHEILLRYAQINIDR